MGVERIEERGGFGAGGLESLRGERPLLELGFLGGGVFDGGEVGHGSKELGMCLGDGAGDEAWRIQFGNWFGGVEGVVCWGGVFFFFESFVSGMEISILPHHSFFIFVR